MNIPELLENLEEVNIRRGSTGEITVTVANLQQIERTRLQKEDALEHTVITLLHDIRAGKGRDFAKPHTPDPDQQYIQ